MRTADIYVFGKLAGALTENDDGKFAFLYETQYLNDPAAVAVSCTMPLRPEAYVSDALFPFFDGLIPEGWLLDIAEKNWKLDGRDRISIKWSDPSVYAFGYGTENRRLSRSLSLPFEQHEIEKGQKESDRQVKLKAKAFF